MSANYETVNPGAPLFVSAAGMVRGLTRWLILSPDRFKRPYEQRYDYPPFNQGHCSGVGFRPYLHRLAEKYRIAGWARNTSSGLECLLRDSQRP